MYFFYFFTWQRNKIGGNVNSVQYNINLLCRSKRLKFRLCLFDFQLKYNFIFNVKIFRGLRIKKRNFLNIRKNRSGVLIRYGFFNKIHAV